MNDESSSLPDVNLFTEPYFFFSSNVQSKLVYVSPSVEQVLGYRLDELIGKTFYDFLDNTSPLNSDILNDQAGAFQQAPNSRQLCVVLTRNGEVKVVDVQTYRVLDEQGQPGMFHSIAQDVTNRHFGEQQIQTRMKELDRIHDLLSDRERFVLDRVMKGLPNKTIANRLDITERTIEKIRSRLVQKFNATSMIEVVLKSTQWRTLHHVLNFVEGVDSAHQGPPPKSRVLRKVDRPDVKPSRHGKSD